MAEVILQAFEDNDYKLTKGTLKRKAAIAVAHLAQTTLEVSQFYISDTMTSWQGPKPASQSGRGPPADGSSGTFVQHPQEVQLGLTILEDIGQAQNKGVLWSERLAASSAAQPHICS